MSQSACVWYLKQSDIFNALTDADLEQVISTLEDKEFGSNQLIFTPQESEGKVYLLKEGEVKIYQRSVDGKKFVIDTIIAGDIFGDLALAENTLAIQEKFARASTPVKVCILSKEDFLRVLQSKPQAAYNIIQKLSEKLTQAESKIRDLALHNVSIRLLNELVRFAKKHGKESPEGTTIHHRLTHEELADMIGATRETVTKALGELKEKGFLSYNKDKEIVLNEKKIEGVI
jgi:CRP-like cAMP-binding protein